uniref:AB hydrolase-1 domain-containing protein n=1 Tax=Arcella intermedia TaxID=1963864 RepID=A0A6B2L7R4_9EUKA
MEEKVGGNEKGLLERTELQIEIQDIKVSLVRWGWKGEQQGDGSDKYLLVHGWLDNAASFEGVVGHLMRHPPFARSQLVALDLPGHGHSSHSNRTYHLVDYVQTLLRIADALGWTEFCLIGHSLGANICLLLSSTIPNRVKRLILIDSLGPFTSFSSSAHTNLQKALEWTPPPRRPRYPSLHDAAKRRSEANVVGTLDYHSAKVLTERGCQKIQSTEGHKEEYQWTYDPWLKQPAPFRFTAGGIISFIRKVECPALLILAKDGILREYGVPWVLVSLSFTPLNIVFMVIFKVVKFICLLLPGWIFKDKVYRTVAVILAYIKRIYAFRKFEIKISETGGHHLHMTQAETVARDIANWVSKYK